MHLQLLWLIQKEKGLWLQHLGIGSGLQRMYKSMARQVQSRGVEGLGVISTEEEAKPRIRDVPNGVQGEHVAAGWPPWLTAVALEAIHGWLPRKEDSFEKLEKVCHLSSRSSLFGVVCWAFEHHYF